MNILYINTHDTGKAISPYGFYVATNNLYELARQSTVFSHAFCAAPTCSPSRAAMMTGQFPHQNGMLGLAQRGFSLNHPDKHLAYYLRSQGYHTVLCGIQHEVGWYLDIDEAALHGIGYDQILTAPTGGYQKEDLHLWDHKNAEAVAAYLQSYHSDRPFMISFGMHSTHRPFAKDIDERVDENYLTPAYPADNNRDNRHDQAQFNTSVLHADDCVGIVLKALKESGHDQDTMVMFTTDHGIPMPFNKCYLTDAGIGVSMIIYVPNSAANGTVADGMISQIDVFPTICDILGIRKPDYLEGKSFARLFSGDLSNLDDCIFAEVNFHTSYEPIRCIRTNRYKYIKYYDNTWDHINLSNIDESIPKSFLMKNGLQQHKKEMEELFDLYYDPYENHNLVESQEYADVRRTLSEKLREKQIATEDPLLSGPLEMKASYKVNKKECLFASSKDPRDYQHLPQ